MKKLLLLFVLQMSMTVVLSAQAVWISLPGVQNTPNTWLSFRKQFEVERVPDKALARIAADSKYWLWINGQLCTFEGSLKRGPNPSDSYVDEVDIAPYLKKGNNTIAVLLWYFGKEGFSHKNSGKAGLFFDCRWSGGSIASDDSWKCMLNEAYGSCSDPQPNFRLAESSISYDARKAVSDWMSPDYNDSNMSQAEEIGQEGSAPWGRLVPRPIPLWKDYGLKKFVSQEVRGDTLICRLPYNAQFTPYIKVRSVSGRSIQLQTDNYVFYNGGDTGVRAEYITCDGVQEYESFGWLNGHNFYLIAPADVEILDVRFRETGYDTEFAGRFESSDSFLNDIWKKAARTLYITMRDTYMDCPDRERAQWTGDAVNEAHESYYALSVSSHALTRKWLYELIGWQKADGSVFAPAPAGNWDKELPSQSLASLGRTGLWTYYLYTGDKQILEDLYSGVERYLSLYEPDGAGNVKLRHGGWSWGDWGENCDMLLICNFWYYMALDAMHDMAVELGKTEDAQRYELRCNEFKKALNARFWNGTAYRDPSYTGRTDDRVQALAVVSGVASPEQYPSLMDQLRKERHASPYMEKYVYEAMMIMGYEEEALARNKDRFSKMVYYPGNFTTLFEGWGIGNEGFGGGTVNHAWSGGTLTVAAQYVCGVSPIRAGFQKFSVLPQPGDVSWASLSFPTVRGVIESSYEDKGNTFIQKVTVPEGTTAIIGVPYPDAQEVVINGKSVWAAGRYVTSGTIKAVPDYKASHLCFEVPAGRYVLKSIK